MKAKVVPDCKAWRLCLNKLPLKEEAEFCQLKYVAEGPWIVIPLRKSICTLDLFYGRIENVYHQKNDSEG